MDILAHFQFEDVGQRLEDLETPVPVIDIAVVERNLARWQARCDTAGFANRPHIKTHKLVPLARAQLALGAKGVTVQKLGEAEVMAGAGIADMLLTFNVVGRNKLERLAALRRRADISVVADNQTVVEGLGYAGRQAGRDIAVLVECDTGAHRNGVQSPEAAAGLARAIDRTKGLRYGGLMTYAKPGMRREANRFLLAARDLIARAGLDTGVITTGGTPDMWRDEGLEGVTEYRAGTYVYLDRSLVERGLCDWGDCALTVLATVVSRPAPERALIDAGSKALTSDLLGLAGYGAVPELGLARVYEVNEEHGFLDLSGVAEKPRVGDPVRIVPNHVCPVSNLFDKVVFVRGREVLGAVKVDARGAVQ
jgi:D-serine deaminase-like pyridoxal phosphate-dependent protein